MNPATQVKEITKFACTDGKEFGNRQMAINYQDQINLVRIANAKLEEGQDLYSALLTLMPKRSIPKNFKGVTRNTGIKIPHWQCHEKPIYKIARIENNLKIFVGGYIDKYRGGYGEQVQVYDLERYIKNTKN